MAFSYGLLHLRITQKMIKMIKRNYMFACSMLILLTLGCEYSGDNKSEGSIGLDLSKIDSTTSPAEDFFRYANGRWLDETEIPGDQGTWGSFNELIETNNNVVLSVLEKAAKSDRYDEDSDQKKAGYFYSVGMDSLLAEKGGIDPIRPYLDHVDKIENIQDLQNYLSQQQILGGGGFFGFSIFPDLKDSKAMAAYLSQGGLGLPDKAYYTKTDSRSKEIREKYVAHIEKMLGFISDGDQSLKEQSARIMALEMRLASASMTRVERRNVSALYNKMSIADVSELAPSFDWNKYLADMNVSGVDTLIVGQPKFIAEFEKIINEEPIQTWKEYLKWNIISGAANYLSSEIVQARFDFYSAELRGVKEMRPRWKRVLRNTNRALGEAIGKLYVEETFPPEAKASAQEMVENIKKAYVNRINNLEWMTDSTKRKAIEKLTKMTVKIGYPDEWRDYSALTVSNEPEKSSYFQNILNAAKFRFEYQLSKLGKPVDKKTWGLPPQTVNAYFNPLFNEIVFPAAILQPPFYDYRADAALNFGGIGAVIGHEISHGFDDQGSRFDADGNLKNWWSSVDSANFKARTGLLVDQFNSYEPLDSVTVNGQLTLGENIGDLGGINAAFDGLMNHLKDNGDPGLIDGLTPQQRFFFSYATIWRIKYKDETLRTRINTDPHSPGMYRANGPLTNLEEFYKAFNVKEGDGMWKPDSLRVKIW